MTKIPLVSTAKIEKMIKTIKLNIKRVRFDLVGFCIKIISPDGYIQAEKFIKQSKYPEAIDLLNIVLIKNPNFAPAYFKLGFAYLKLENWHEASRYIGKAIELWPLRLKWKVQLNEAKFYENLFCEIKPNVALYISGLSNVAYQANMWVPVLERLNIRPIIIVRERRVIKNVVKTQIPIVFVKNLRELELIARNGIKTILYPANGQKNMQAFRMYWLNHFFINHGESDKVVNQSKALMAYDKILVSGPLAESRLKAAGLPLRNGQVVHVGRPTAEILLKKNKRYPINSILYAPTWEGFVNEANYSSINIAIEILTELIRYKNNNEEVRIIFKPHPYTGVVDKSFKSNLKLIEKFCISNQIEYADPNCSIYPLMNESDLLLTDISSVINDYLYTEKPIFLTKPKNLTSKVVNSIYYSSRVAYIINDVSDLKNMIDDINLSDVMFDTRIALKKIILGDLPNGYLNEFNKIVEASL